MSCPTCGKELNFGDWPFCKGNPDDHTPTRQKLAQEGAPTIVYKNAEGKLWFPQGEKAKPPSGYVRHELRTLQERDAFERDVDEKETQKLRDRIYRDRANWEEIMSRNRSELAKLKDMGPEGRHLSEAVRADMERRDKEFDRKLRERANFMVEVSHYYGRGNELDD
jgi:hypothetical protein